MYYLFLLLFPFCLIEIFNRFAENPKIDIQGLSIKRNIFRQNMIKIQMKKTEKFMIYFN
jgi:hypothetical protein